MKETPLVPSSLSSANHQESLNSGIELTRTEVAPRASKTLEGPKHPEDCLWFSGHIVSSYPSSRDKHEPLGLVQSMRWNALSVSQVCYRVY